MTVNGWTPYADGTSGHQGEASQAAEPDRRSSLPRAFGMVRRAERRGLTVIELRTRTGWHHGQASGALSNLHRTGLVVRLAERRGRAGIYVTPDQVGGRETVPYRSNAGGAYYPPIPETTDDGGLWAP